MQHSHSYKVKIINPSRKSDVIVRQLHDYYSRFESVVGIRAKLIERFKDQVPNSISFDVGYFEGQQHSKVWLYSKEDLQAMYIKYPKGEITLWCEGVVSEEESIGHGKRKRDEPVTGASKRQEKEDEVDTVFRELKYKHGNKYDVPRLCLWARMVTSKLHEDMDSPPNIPAFNCTPKRPKRGESLASALSGAAVTFANALGDTPRFDNASDVSGHDSSTEPLPLVSAGVSPRKAVDLRMKNYEQLCYLQCLFDDSILSETEFIKQKRSILGFLKKL